MPEVSDIPNVDPYFDLALFHQIDGGLRNKKTKSPETPSVFSSQDYTPYLKIKQDRISFRFGPDSLRADLSQGLFSVGGILDKEYSGNIIVEMMDSVGDTVAQLGNSFALTLSNGKS